MLALYDENNPIIIDSDNEEEFSSSEVSEEEEQETDVEDITNENHIREGIINFSHKKSLS